MVILLNNHLPHTRHSLIVTVQNNGFGLLPHFIDHYRKLGIKRFLFGIQDVPNQQEIIRELKTLGDDVFVVAKMIGYNPCGYVMANAIRDNINSDWFLVPDLDEFQEYPIQIDQLLDDLDSANLNCVLGRLVDRITADGHIPEVLTSENIMQQVPVPVLFSERIMKQTCRKVMLVRKDLVFNGGKHSAKGERPFHQQGIAWHIKWFGNMNHPPAKDGWVSCFIPSRLQMDRSTGFQP